MSSVTYEKERVALLVVDPYNDFISEGGKVWSRVKEVAEAVNCVPNMRRILQTSRELGLRIFFVPHHRWRDGDYATWKYLAPVQERANNRKTFEYGTWGGEFHPDFQPVPGDIVVQEHWCSSGFANTDLDLLLKRHGIQQTIIVGLLANTCIDSTINRNFPFDRGLMPYRSARRRRGRAAWLWRSCVTSGWNLLPRVDRRATR